MNFDQAFAKVIGHEGGYVNDPKDPGGETKFGVSKRAYPKEDIANLTLERAKEIYKEDYWDKCKADHLPNEIKYAHFDMGVNAGLRTAAKNLQRAAGVAVDGAIGPMTIQAAMKVTIAEYIMHRAFHYMRITAKNHDLAKYGNGWANRIEHIYNESKDA